MPAVAQWFVGGDTGISSKYMAAVALARHVLMTGWGDDTPSDSDDLRRCIWLIAKHPHVRDAFPVLRTASPVGRLRGSQRGRNPGNEAVESKNVAGEPHARKDSQKPTTNSTGIDYQRARTFNEAKQLGAVVGRDPKLSVPASRCVNGVEKTMRQVMKKAQQLADLMTEDDVQDDLRVVREAKQANNRYFDTNTRTMIETPDHKTRLAATQFSRAYAEGLPVARQVTLQALFEGAEATMERLRASPEALKALGGIHAAGAGCCGGWAGYRHRSDRS